MRNLLTPLIILSLLGSAKAATAACTGNQIINNTSSTWVFGVSRSDYGSNGIVSAGPNNCTPSWPSNNTSCALIPPNSTVCTNYNGTTGVVILIDTADDTQHAGFYSSSSFEGKRITFDHDQTMFATIDGAVRYNVPKNLDITLGSPSTSKKQ